MKARSALAGVLVPGRSGEPSGMAGVTVQEQPPSGCAHVAARAASLAAVIEAMQALGLALAQRPGWSDGGGFRAVWLGPERWLVFGTGDVEALLRQRLGTLASVSDQSDSRMVLRLSGPLVREALAKGVPIDLHPRAFHTGDAAVTQVAHVGVTLWQLDDAPTYDLAVARSYAGSLAEWLIAAAAEYGLLVQ
jgi:sarcosine oxidase subunit gamma